MGLELLGYISHNPTPAAKKQRRANTKANQKKSIFLLRLIKKCKLKNPVKKLEIRAGQELTAKEGLFKNFSPFL